MISPLARADADRVDAHAAVGGHARRLDRIGAGGRLAVGQQDDGRADVYEPGGTGLGGALSGGLRGIERRRSSCAGAARIGRAQVEFDVGKDRLQRHEDAAADRRAALQLEAVDRAQDVLAAVRRRLHDRRGRGERHDADARGLRLLGDERARGLLRRDDAVGLDVGRAHAAGDVHRQDHGFVLRRQRDHRRRTRDRDEHQRQRDQEQQRRHVAAQALAARPWPP